jgi:general secretion pathway protein D
VLASDGETIVLGGLISKQDNRQENGIPFFKNIPYVGALFRYRTQSVAKRELLIIMTPHIIRSEFDNARLLSEESRRMNWCVPDLAKVHGHGIDVIGPAMKGANPVPMPTMTYPAGPAYFGPIGGDANPGMIYPQGTMIPPGTVIQQPTAAQPPTAMPTPQPVPVIVPAIPPAPAPGVPVSANPVPYGVTPAGATAFGSPGATAATWVAPVAPPMTMAPPPQVPGGPMMPAAPTAWTMPPVAPPKRGYLMSQPAEGNGTPPATQPTNQPTEGKKWEALGR